VAGAAPDAPEGLNAAAHDTLKDSERLFLACSAGGDGSGFPNGRRSARGYPSYARHYVATSTTGIFAVKTMSYTIMVFSIPGEAG
jgi:hypothetical protein